MKPLIQIAGKTNHNFRRIVSSLYENGRVIAKYLSIDNTNKLYPEETDKLRNSTDETHILQKSVAAKPVCLEFDSL